MIPRGAESKLIEARASGLAALHGTRCPLRIARAEGFRIYHSELGGLRGFYSRILGFDVICINNRLDEREERTVAAHELGHGILHSGPEQPTIPDADLWRNTMAECEANAFAAHLLIPTDALCERLAECGEGTGADAPEALAAFFCCDVNLILFKIKELRKQGMLFNLPFDPDALFLKSAAGGRKKRKGIV